MLEDLKQVLATLATAVLYFIVIMSLGYLEYEVCEYVFEHPLILGVFLFRIELLSAIGLFVMMIKKIKDRKFAAAFGLLLASLLFGLLAYDTATVLYDMVTVFIDT